MNSPASRKKDWTLTQEAFDRLLVSFDADRERAAQKYESIRSKLIKYFEWRGAAQPDGEADETINRVARKIEEGAEVHNLNAYFYGVARLVFAESLKERERQQSALEHAPAVEMHAADDAAEAERRRACLESCLRRLPEESRALIVEYYQEEKGRKIERRKHLASRLLIPLNALRIRAHRIRIGLEACVRECLDGRHA